MFDPCNVRTTARRTGAILAVASALSAVGMLAPAAPAKTIGSAELNVAIPFKGGDGPCPPGYGATTDCHPRTGGPVAVPGLGFVSETSSFAIETDARPRCSIGLGQVAPTHSELSVRGRGTIFLALSGNDTCAELDRSTLVVLNVPQAFTITGGSGVFAGANGSGIVTRSGTGYGIQAYGVDNWRGTLSAPDFDQELAPPVITGAADRIVTAPRRAKTVRVRYTITANDDGDGAVPVVCAPHSGARFKVGRTTTVHCMATDKSANIAKATFSVSVRRAKR
jgi:HYR domain-containing protein